MDPRLRGRIDAADVVQDAFVEAGAHRGAYFRAPLMPLFLWLRGVDDGNVVLLAVAMAAANTLLDALGFQGQS